MIRASMKSISVLTFFVVLCGMNQGLAEEPGTSAAEIVKVSGVTGGLIVHLGVTDGALEKALVSQKTFIVHGLAGNEKQLVQARSHLDQGGLYGRASN